MDADRRQDAMKVRKLRGQFKEVLYGKKMLKKGQSEYGDTDAAYTELSGGYDVSDYN